MIKNVSMIKAKKRGKKRVADHLMGKVALMELEGLTFEVAITDYSNAYGHDLFTVKPRRGDGSKVVRGTSLTLA